MRSSILISFQVILALLIWCNSGSAQGFDPYLRLSDPRGICRFDGPDTLPVRMFSGIGSTVNRDKRDDYYVIAEAQGSGIITHIWLMYFELPADSALTVKIWIDDSLVISSYLYQLFRDNHGILRHPLDSLASGGLNCDLQLEYKKNYKITYYSDVHNGVCCLFWGIEYRPIIDPKHLETFTLTPSAQYETQLANAEKSYYAQESPWRNESPTVVNIADQQIQPGQTLDVANLAGPGMIQTVTFSVDTNQFIALNNTWLQIFWDDSPETSVDVPLTDFFGCGSGFRNTRSFQIRSTEAGIFTSYLPMPFRVGAAIHLVNKSSSAISIGGSISFSTEEVDPMLQGYLFAQFNESLKTQWHKYQHIGDLLGRGKFIGMQLALPKDPPPNYLEGDPFIDVDSLPQNRLTYPGTEDYMTGGWFFSDTTFSLPFSGCTHKWKSMYRFHYLDAVDFGRSFSFNFQHGVDNDYATHYRTVGYFYKRWTPFWVSRDTVRPGQLWSISGSGYNPNELLRVKIGAFLFSNIQADASGKFNAANIIFPEIPEGVYHLSINGYEQPEPIYCFSQPTLQIINDTLPHIVRYGDHIGCYCTGFEPGEKISIFFDSTAANYTFSNHTIGTDYSSLFSVRVPWVKPGVYHIMARGDRGNSAMADTAITVTRRLNYECESLQESFGDEGYPTQEIYLGYSKARWSNQYTHQLWPSADTQRLELRLNIPVSDTFAVTFYNTYGSNYGKYNIFIDNKFSTTFDGYRDTPGILTRSDSINGGIWYLEAGDHTIGYKCIGKDTNSAWYVLNADNIIFTPTTEFYPLPPKKIDTISVFGKIVTKDLEIFCSPNPLFGHTLNIEIGLGTTFEAGNDYLKIKLYNNLGEVVATIFDGNPTTSKLRLTHDCSGLSNGAYYLRMNTIGKGGSAIKTVPLRIEMN